MFDRKEYGKRYYQEHKEHLDELHRKYTDNDEYREWARKYNRVYKIVCPQCKRKWQGNYIYCPKCGIKMREDVVDCKSQTTAENMHEDCKYCVDEFCVNDQCPAVGDYCHCGGYQEICRFMEEKNDE